MWGYSEQGWSQQPCPFLPQHGEVTCLCPGQWQSWNQDVVWNRTQSRLNHALLTFHLATPCDAAFTPAPATVQLSKESLLECDWKCQCRGSSGKSWRGDRVLQDCLNTTYSTQALSSPDCQPCAFATSSGVQQLGSIFSQVTEPLPAESQALLSTASAL